MHDEIYPTWTLITGKGPDSLLLEPILRGLAPTFPSVRIEVLNDAAPSLPAPTRRGRLVLDATCLTAGDVKKVQRYLAEASGWELVLLDREGIPCLARELVGPPHVYWWPGPVLVEQAMRLLHPPRPRDSAKLPEHAPEQVPCAAPSTPPVFQRQRPAGFIDSDDEDDELDAIQAILSAPFEELDKEASDRKPLLEGFGGGIDGGIGRCFDQPRPLRDPEALDNPAGQISDYDPEREDANMHFPVADPFAAEPGTTWGEHGKPPPQTGSEHPVDLLLRDQPESTSARLDEAPDDDFLQADPLAVSPTDLPKANADWQSMAWYKGQVADLNDLAQRLHLDLFALEEDESLHGHSIAIALREDVARLSQFARTLGFLAAPPAPGHQTFSLATMVQEQLGMLSGLGPDAPRFLFRSGDDALVRSDKILLVSALDAVLQVAGQCAGAHPETVRVECQLEGHSASVSIGFRPGPIADFTPEEVFEPYALRACLEDIGPNALSAARSIMRSQGGDLSLQVADWDAFRFELSLPQAT
ncbi:MAG: hypothetical protein GY930_16180 [bacterium]|nr:hypothetical protein [bacterium]